MQFRIANTFTDSLVRLTGDEQKAAKTTVFDLQVNPANPGMQFHKVDTARDPHFWSVRVSRDIRLIVHRSADSLLLCYVDHHDEAYRWAERRKLETHPRTGAAQLVEIRETVQETAVPAGVVEDRPAEVTEAAAKPPLFADVPEDELLGFGVPPEWLEDVRDADEDSLLELADHLPGEAAEALLELATGGRPQQTAVAAETVDPFEHPDAGRRFLVVTDAEELARAFEFLWEKRAVFPHPVQRAVVEQRGAEDSPVVPDAAPPSQDKPTANRAMRGKYAPLYRYLITRTSFRWRASFSEIETVLGFGLPASARRHPAWWANQDGGGHSHARAWREAGRRTKEVDLKAETLVFERMGGVSNSS